MGPPPKWFHSGKLKSAVTRRGKQERGLEEGVEVGDAVEVHLPTQLLHDVEHVARSRRSPIERRAGEPPSRQHGEERNQEVDRRLQDRARSLAAEPAEALPSERLDRPVEPELVVGEAESIDQLEDLVDDLRPPSGRREDDSWKLVHRHADPITTPHPDGPLRGSSG